MMLRQTKNMRTIALTMGLALSLTACVSFGGKAPASMLVLTAQNAVAAGSARSGTQTEAVIIQTPEVPRKLDTNRIPVQIDASSIAYIKDAFWADKPARLIQSLLAETVAAKGRKLVLNEVDAGGKADLILSGSLLEFGISAASNEAVVVYDAVKITRGQPTELRRFEARRPISAVEPALSGSALNSAANDVASQIADWIN